MSADSLETSVPFMPIATPICASFKAGASFTPSPVIVTISPFCLRAFTILNLCSGLTLANIVILFTIFASSSSVNLSISSPVMTLPERPISFPISTAVSLLSPVIILTFIPLSLQEIMVGLTFALGGSSMATKPKKIRLFSKLFLSREEDSL